LLCWNKATCPAPGEHATGAPRGWILAEEIRSCRMALLPRLGSLPVKSFAPTSEKRVLADQRLGIGAGPDRGDRIVPQADITGSGVISCSLGGASASEITVLEKGDLARAWRALCRRIGRVVEQHQKTRSK